MSYNNQIKQIVKIAEDILGVVPSNTPNTDFVSLGICPLPNNHGFQVWLERPIFNENAQYNGMQIASYEGTEFFEDKKTLDDALKALYTSLTTMREQTHPTYITIKGIQYMRADKK